MKAWFITGASRGFGYEVALEALRRGDRIVATARSLDALDDVVAIDPERVAVAQLDVTKRDEILRSIEIARERFGNIDILFNNAGIGYFAAVEESDDARVRRLMEVNVFGLAAVTKAWLPHLREQRSGLILNTSSVGGIRSFPAVGWYNASKFAVEGLSEALAQEIEPLGIKVVIVEPGPFATDWAGNSAAEVPDADAIADYDQTAGKQRRTFRENVGQEPGDPAKAARSRSRMTIIRRCACRSAISVTTARSRSSIWSARMWPPERRPAAVPTAAEEPVMPMDFSTVGFLGFDVFGTVVDWRTGVARASEPFLARHGIEVDPLVFADEWRALYQPSMQKVRAGERPWVKLEILNRENLETVLSRHDADFGRISDAELVDLNKAWERLDPWPDSLEGLTRLKRRFALGPLSNGHIAGMLNLARYGGLPWDVITGAEVTKSYKPMPQTYLRSADAVGLRPDQVGMVAAHNDDLKAARAAGLRTVFVRRPHEHGSNQTTDLDAKEDWDVIAESLTEAADALGCN